MIVVCSKCGQNFERHHPLKLVCRPCEARYQREYMRAYRQDRPHFENTRYQRRLREDPNLLEQKRQAGRRYWADLRQAGMAAYGGYVCACCGETEPKFLSLDHVDNNGSEHRKEIKNRGSGIFKWLRDNGYPAGFQVLCMNCNHGKALNNGVCPHKTASS